MQSGLLPNFAIRGFRGVLILYKIQLKVKNIFFIICVFSVFISAATPKEFTKKLERADVLYEGGNYADALNLYLDLYTQDSSNSNLCYKIGSCYLKNNRQHKKAIYFLEKASPKAASDYLENDAKEKRAPLKTFKLLADAYHLNNDFEKAVTHYRKYRAALVADKLADKDDLKELDRKIQTCLNAKELVTNPVDALIENLGDAINSDYPDYCPRISADQQTLVFTSRRPSTTGGKTFDGGQYFEDIYISTRKNDHWQPAQNIGWPVNTVGNEAAVAISADGQQMLIYKDDMGNGNIYSSCLDGDKWTTPVRLNSNINSPYWESSACISADGNTIYFVSDRPGGHGGADIYKSSKQDGGDWGPAVNLGSEVNTVYDEYAPFLHADGRTLYFSSKGHKTMGGFDIFYSSLQENGKWTNPRNIGYPVNSTGDDAFFIVSPDKKTAYYSSYRDSGVGEKDNYKITFTDLPGSAVSLLKGLMVDETSGMVKNGVITVTDKSSNTVGVHRPNSKTGEYLVVLSPGSYNISYEGDGLLFYSLNQYVPNGMMYSEQQKNIRLSPIAVGSSVELNNIYFDFDAAELKAASRGELDKLYGLLVQNDKLSVQVSGYADSKGTDEYNRKLSFERAQAVTNYLVAKGIEKNRIKAVGLGKEQTENSQPVGGLNPSGRRVELKITEINNNHEK
jgi:outer membrane protein OmpA-like peptidoglycan-associated protein/tetratricopeptide (TPR) repeat protein